MAAPGSDFASKLLFIRRELPALYCHRACCADSMKSHNTPLSGMNSTNGNASSQGLLDMLVARSNCCRSLLGKSFCASMSLRICSRAPLEVACFKFSLLVSVLDFRFEMVFVSTGQGQGIEAFPTSDFRLRMVNGCACASSTLAVTFPSDVDAPQEWQSVHPTQL